MDIEQNERQCRRIDIAYIKFKDAILCVVRLFYFLFFFVLVLNAYMIYDGTLEVQSVIFSSKRS